MRTKQFIEQIEELGFTAKELRGSNAWGVLVRGTGAFLATVSSTARYSRDTRYTTFMALPDSDKRDLLDVVEEYSDTPVEDREDLKRYRLKADLPALTDTTELYLNLIGGQYRLNSRDNTASYKTIFTEDELRFINETGFTREEVIEDEN